MLIIFATAQIYMIPNQVVSNGLFKYLNMHQGIFINSVSKLLTDSSIKYFNPISIYMRFEYLTSHFYLILFIVALIFTFVYKTKDRLLLAGWILIPTTVFFIHYQEFRTIHFMFIRRIIVCLPAFAIITALFLTKIERFDFESFFYKVFNKKLYTFKRLTYWTKNMTSYIIIPLVLIVGAVNFIAINYSFDEKTSNLYTNDIDITNFVGRFQAKKLNWDPQEIVSLFEKNGIQPKKIFFFNLEGEVWWILRSEFKEKEITRENSYINLYCKVHYFAKTAKTGEMMGWIDYQECINLIEGSDFVVFEDKKDQMDYPNLKNDYNVDKTYNLWESQVKNRFVLLKSFKNSYDAQIEIYQKKL